MKSKNIIIVYDKIWGVVINKDLEQCATSLMMHAPKYILAKV